MSDLYAKIDIAGKFQPADSAPAVNHTEQTSLGLDWAARQAAQPKTPEPLKPGYSVYPVSN